MAKTTGQPKIAYISGPMTGKKDYNFPAFHEVAKGLKNVGIAVLNPASNFEGVTDFPIETYMKYDFFQVLQADLLVVLPGWEESVGARAEVLVAQAIGLPIYRYAGEMLPYPAKLDKKVRTYVDA